MVSKGNLPEELEGRTRPWLLCRHSAAGPRVQSRAGAVRCLPCPGAALAGPVLPTTGSGVGVVGWQGYRRQALGRTWPISSGHQEDGGRSVMQVAPGPAPQL